jgi:hypothetical protein
MEDKSEKENKNKVKMKIYEDQTQIQDFVEPKWMKILEKILERRATENYKYPRLLKNIT